MRRVFQASTGAGGPEFQVNSTALQQACAPWGAPALAVGDTAFVVVWEDAFVVRAQILDWSGQRIGSEFQVNTSPTDALAPTAAWTPQGEFIVAWSQGLPRHIRAQRFAAAGGRLGGEFQVDVGAAGNAFPEVAASRDGRIVAAWMRNGQVIGRRIDASGTPVGAEFQVSVNVGGSIPISAAVTDAGFMVVWWTTTAGWRVAGRAFDRDGNPVSNEISIDPSGGDLPDVAPYGPARYVVSWNSPTCPYIHALVRRGVATGCGNGKFCPGDPVTREQVPVFVLRTLDPSLSPPACTTPLFADVPASSPFCRWIEELARRGVVAGCGGGNYCPAAPVTREQMAVFLTVSFNLELYGP